MTAETLPRHTTETNEAKTEPAVRVERVGSGSPLFDRARIAEKQFFANEEYTDHEGEGVTGMKEYAEYDANSVFNVVLYGEEIVGVLREIYVSEDTIDWLDDSHPTGFKTVDDFKYEMYEGFMRDLVTWRPSQVLEVGTVVVDPAWRRQTAEVASRLYHEMYRSARQNDKDFLIASMDDDLFQLFYRELYNFVQVGDTKYYMGSDTTPVAMDLRTIADYLKTRHPEFYRMGILGEFDD